MQYCFCSSADSPAPKHMPVCSHRAGCLTQAQRAFPATPTAGSSVPKWENDIQRMKGGERVMKRRNRVHIWQKKKMHGGGRKEEGWLEKTMVHLAPWSVSIFIAEKGVVLGCNFSLSDPSFRMIWLRHLTEQASMCGQTNPITSACRVFKALDEWTVIYIICNQQIPGSRTCKPPKQDQKTSVELLGKGMHCNYHLYTVVPLHRDHLLMNI